MKRKADIIAEIMRVPFTDIRVEYMDTPERKVLDLRRDGIKEVPMLGWCNYSRARPDSAHCHKGMIEVHFLDRGQQFFEVEGHDTICMAATCSSRGRTNLTAPAAGR